MFFFKKKESKSNKWSVYTTRHKNSEMKNINPKEITPGHIDKHTRTELSSSSCKVMFGPFTFYLHR